MRNACAWIAGAVFAWVVSGTAVGQLAPHPVTPPGGPSTLPSGDGTIRGVVLDASAPGETAGLTVALYALQPDGTPGIGSTVTAGDGSFEFPGVSSDPGIVYLIGVRYRLVPYGERTAFVAGQQAIDVMLPVERPTSDGSKLTVVETTLQIESRGTRLTVLETQKIANAGSLPVFVPQAERAGREAPFRAVLPDGASDFQGGAFNATDAFERRGSELLYWGPLYAGEQELRYAYSVPVASGAEVVSLRHRFPLGTGRVRVLTSPHGPEVESGDLAAGAPVEIEGARLEAKEGGAREPGGELLLIVHVPETSTDRTALTLGRAELSVELDDTVLEVTQSQRIEVASGANLAGVPGDPLLRFDLPVDARLVGLSTEAGELGANVVDQGVDKAVEIYGPLGPGTHDLAFRYRLPATDGSARLDLQFPLTVPTLFMRTADTGVLIESDRLHRLRPQPMGTRMWILREAFHVPPDEVVSIRFRSLPQAAPSPLGSWFFVVVASGFVLLFVVAPLRKTRRVRVSPEDERMGLAHERDLVYATIRDLEHDFETGKVEHEDYERSRAELREAAVELMRQERQTAPAASAPRPAPAPRAIPTGKFCPSCGGAVDTAWRFCSHCGGALRPPSPEQASGAEPTG